MHSQGRNYCSADPLFSAFSESSLIILNSTFGKTTHISELNAKGQKMMAPGGAV